MKLGTRRFLEHKISDTVTLAQPGRNIEVSMHMQGYNQILKSHDL